MSAVDDVRERIDIVSLIGTSTELRKAGRLFKGLCPFHEERTPSFVVYPETGRWQCFGACATGGDVFSFVMRRDGVTFREALETLALQAGVVLEAATPQAEARKAERDRWREALSQAADFFHGQLLRQPAAERAREYLKRRQFDKQTAIAFQLGWAPEGGAATHLALRAAGFSDDELLAAGLVKRRDAGGVYDVFRGRLMFPIKDTLGRTVGFGGRTLVKDEVPKYVNSPQSGLFDKSHLLYGLDRAKSAIHSAGRAVVVEGYTDVIRAQMAGFLNVVASLGTALTESHVRLLCRYTKAIVLALDADAAGQAATLRGLDVAAAAAGETAPVPTAGGWIRYEQVADVRLHVAVLPAGQDPDDVVRDTPELWETIVRDAPPMMAYLFDTLTADLDLGRPDDKTTAVERLAPIVAAIGNPVTSAAWLDELAQRTGIDRRAIAGRARGHGEQRARHTGLGPGDTAGREVRPQRDRSAWLLGRLAEEPRRLTRLNDRLRGMGLAGLSADEWPQGIDRALFEAVRMANRGALPPDAPAGQSLESLPAEVEAYARELGRQLADEPPLVANTEVEVLETAVLRVRETAARAALTGVRTLLQECEPGGRDALQLRLRELTLELAKLQKRLHGSQGRCQGEGERAARS
jgi:DNA primase